MESAMEMQTPAIGQEQKQQGANNRLPVLLHLPSNASVSSSPSSTLPLAQTTGGSNTNSEASLNHAVTSSTSEPLSAALSITTEPLKPPSASSSAADGTLQIWLNNSKANLTQGFPSNEIRTSRYALWNFLPLNLFEQFRRFANLYFLVITGQLLRRSHLNMAAHSIAHFFCSSMVSPCV
jgi:hypothetical protein